MTIPPPAEPPAEPVAPAEPPAPPITAALRAEARARPGSWLYRIDPAFDPDGAVPGYAVKGGWQIDEQGNPVRWVSNPNYRPSPRALAMYVPQSPVEDALQRAATGYGPEAVLLAALLDAPLAVLAHPHHHALHVEEHPDARGVITAYTSPRHLPADWPGHRTFTGRQLAAALPGVLLRLNPTVRPSATLPLDDVAAAARIRPA